MNHFVTFIIFLFTLSIIAQKDEKSLNLKDYYPISQRPYISGGVGNNDYEQILFDAKPVVYYGIYNNINKALSQESIKPGYAVYINLQPQIRMYQETSKPIKTPSYKVLFGWQPIIKTNNNDFLTFAFETGHYSNGQSQGAFTEEFADESPESNAIYDTITNETNLSQILNRRSGNFSTNLSRLSFNYRLNKFDENDKPTKIHSITLSYQLYHNRFLGFLDFGGYNDRDIKLYGRNQIEGEYEFTSYYKGMRYVLGQELFLHLDSHPSTSPIRSETRGILFPWDTDLGFFAQIDTGFDDYNYRFIDTFNRFSVGLTWDWFTPFVIKPAKKELREQKKEERQEEKELNEQQKLLEKQAEDGSDG